jgi:hypothetical protein
MNLTEMKKISKIIVQFQGGFAAKEMRVEVLNSTSDIKDTSETAGEDLLDAISQKSDSFYPLDINQTQEFTLKEPLEAERFQLVLGSSYDFYGRIIIYNLDIIGS